MQWRFNKNRNKVNALAMPLIVIVLSLPLAITQATEKPSKTVTQVPIEELQSLVETYSKIKSTYVDEVDDKKLFEGAINGMLQSLDPYSRYLSESDLMDLETSSTGSYEGLGVELVKDDEQVRVVDTLSGSPAARAGIVSDDVILSVDDITVSTDGYERAVEAMRGKAGEPITLKVARGDDKQQLVFN
ncbi:MAG: PDZ domain-containing protein, partial [Kangiellaceae bacterium]|nr:PDZ domain-containing protein [Kangiellaceae bacterium]